MALFKNRKFSAIFLQISLAFYTASTAFVLLIYAYIGTFTRYWADDFCFTQSIVESGNLFSATLNVYRTWSNRYTTLLLVGISEWFGRQAISSLPAVMIALWVLGLALLINQIMLSLKMRHQRLPSFLMALLLVFFSILQAPNRFQAVYWRSGMVTYFAPLIFYAFGAAYILNQVRRAQSRWPSAPSLIITALIFFLAGGLSETTLALQIGFLSLSLFALCLWSWTQNRRTSLSLPHFGYPEFLTGTGIGLLLTALIATLISLILVFNAPGNAVRLTSMPAHAPLPLLITASIQFSFDFISSSVKTLPLPTAITFFSALMLSLSYFTREQMGPSQEARPYSLWLLALLPLTALVLIICLIAPSVYVYNEYGYPELRALFPTRFIMTTGIFFEGILLGHLASTKLKTGLGALQWFIAASILFSALYPLWTAQKEIATVPVYSNYAQDWDQRDEKIRDLRAQNVLDVRLDGIESPGSLVELNNNPRRWVNRCVASFYNLNSIAVFIK